MGINDERIRIAVRLENADYVELRDLGFYTNETHQEIAERAIKAELKRMRRARRAIPAVAAPPSGATKPRPQPRRLMHRTG
jgi:hypothetical protein